MEKNLKQLLLKDLYARLPYHVMVEYRGANVDLTQYVRSTKIENCKPYLRPMSSMTKEEKEEYDEISGQVKTFYGREAESHECAKLTDLLNEHYFDYRGLIEKGLALEAPEGMYRGN